ncbi:T9SS type B sorting domain-containing protein [Aquimarina celericrescens]|uniref:T9SS type B sorting domain-containing protein n=1 Tax=Mesonia mobilis TaxID=369791 RepID=UPI000406F62A|nr:T9SS type B sorting domain-containing protein [Mesonia mobilis]MBQ0738368.1 T9SS type B sorting domain-containing protein [Aquimarina celericrescens]
MSVCFFIFFTKTIKAQLGFCSGSKGDPIFQEDFGSGNGTGNPLAAGVTNYTYVVGDPQDGQYTISDQISQQINTWHNALPNTTESNGRALVVNADYTAGLFYQTPISGLCENASYEFSAYLMNIFDSSSGACPGTGIPINVRFEIWNATDTQLLKQGSTGDIAGSSNAFWEQYAMTFQSQPGQNSIILKMFNNSDGGCGNDLAIDDIIFRSCGDLTTISPINSSENEISICEESLPQTINLEANPDFSIYSDHYYQWQRSNDGETWNDIPGANQAQFSTSSISTDTYFRVQVAEDPVNLDDNLCSTFSEAFYVEVIPAPPTPTSNGDVFSCEDGTPPQLSVSVPSPYEVNWYDASTSTTSIASDTETFTPSENGAYFAEAYLPDSPCAAGPRIQLNYNLYDSPQLSSDEIIEICQGETVTLSANISGVIYDWSTGEETSTISVNEEGNYTLTVTNSDGCTATKIFTVQFTEEPEISEVLVENGFIQIITTQVGDFLYSLDGINFQYSNEFQVNEGGVYKAYVKDTEACRVATREFPVLLYPKFITPNEDGKNDVFQLKGIEYFNASELLIFDRFGKLLFQQTGKRFFWDGSYNGKGLPSNEYWFIVNIEGMSTVKGHFSLIK